MKHSKETDLFAMLKRETASVHEQVMEESWAKRVLSIDYTLPEYRGLLQKYYGFYLPLETLLLDFGTSVFYPARLKHPLLHQDLNVLHSPDRFDPVIYSKLPEISGVPSALGICYVLEGATLGGQIIAKHLKNSLVLKEQEALPFFNGYSPDTAKMWTGLKTQTRDIVRTPQELTVILEAALETFNSLSNWMEAS